MAKKTSLLLALAFLFVSPLTRAADTRNILALLKGQCGADDIHRQLETTPRADLDHLADDEGRTGLFFCRHPGTTLLLLAGADPNVRDHAGRTPAFRAVTVTRDPAFPIMLELLALGRADLNARDHDNISLLAWAAHEGNLSAVRLLTLLGADPAPADVPADRAPLFYALQRGDDKMAEVLRNAAADRALAKSTATDAAPGPRLAASARAARLGALTGALAAGADIDARDQDGATALFRAVAERRANVAALLLLYGANPNLARNDGKTPLMQCVTGYDMESERMLVEFILAGADVNAVTKDGVTPLSASVHSRNNTAAQWMLWRGASTDVHTPDGTLMQEAALNQDWPSMIELLKRAGLKEEEPLVAQEKSFRLFTAVRAGDLPAVTAELQNGTLPDVTNKYDQTALEWAACYDQTEIMDLLLSHGANINHQHYYNGEHILHVFAGAKGANTADAAAKMKRLLDRGANPNLVMKDGNTPLMVAAREGGQGPSLDLLLQVTSDVNARNKDGLTALGLARQHGYAGTAKLLQDHSAQE